MRISAVILLASFVNPLANAQSIDDFTAQIPSCAQSCIEKSAGSAGCSPADWTCICTKTSPGSSADACVLSACSTDAYMLVLVVVTQICVQVLTDGLGSDFDFTVPTFSIPGIGAFPTSTINNLPSGDDSSSNRGGSGGSDGSNDRSGGGSSGGSSGSGKGLSTGAIVGIVVGVLVGLLLIAGVVFALFWRRRKRAAKARTAPMAPAAPYFPPPAGAPQNQSPQHPAHTMYNPSNVSPMTQTTVLGSMSPSAPSQSTYYTTPTQATPSPGPQGAYMAGGGGHPSELGAHPANIPEMGTYNPQPSELASVPVPVVHEAGGDPVQPVAEKGAPP